MEMTVEKLRVWKLIFLRELESRLKVGHNFLDLRTFPSLSDFSLIIQQTCFLEKRKQGELLLFKTPEIV